MPQLDELLAAGKFEDAALLLDDAELERDDESMDLPSLQAWPNALHILCLVYADRLIDARFLYKRLQMQPPAVAGEPEVQAALALVQILWQQNYGQVWKQLRSPAWGPRSAAVASALTVKLRDNVASLLGRAYSVTAVTSVESYLGIAKDEVLLLAKERGWELEPDGMLRITSTKESVTMQTGPEYLQRLTDYVLHLKH